MNVRSLTLAILFIVYSSSFIVADAQQKRIDSLTARLKQEKDDSNKVLTLNQLSGMVHNISDFKRSDSIADCALQLAQKIGYKDGEGYAYLNMGGNAVNRGEFKKGIENYLTGLRLFQAVHDTAGEGKAYGSLGSNYLSQGNYPEALKDMLLSLKIAEKRGDKYSAGVELGNMGLVYFGMANYNEAMNSYRKALVFKQQSGNIRGVGNTYDNMGNVYDMEGKYDSGRACEMKAIDLGIATKNRYGLTNEYSDLGSIYFHLGNYTDALKYQFMSLALGKEIGDKEDLCTTYLRLGNIFLKEKKLADAKLYIDSALNLASSIGNKRDVRDSYASRIVLDSLSKNYAAGFNDVRLYNAWRDSLINEETSKKMLSEQMNFEFDKKQAAEKAQEDKKDSMVEEERQKQVTIRNFFIAGFALTLALVFFVLRGYRQKQKANDIITKQKEEMERLSIVARETDNVVIIMAADGTIEWANESFTRINGISMDEVKRQRGNTIYEVSNNLEIKKIIDIAIKERRSVLYEAMNDRKGGARQWESSTLTPIFDNNGKLHKLIIVDADITQSKIAEETIRQKNKDIVDSINYAQRLQEALMASDSLLEQNFDDYFILFKPKDIVSGDFYWIEKEGDTILIAACDCTGHGVPGAMVSVVCSNALRRALNEYLMRDTGKLLDKTRELVLETFSRKNSTGQLDETDVQDGMDISLCAINLKDKRMEWSGANNPLWIIRGGSLIELAPDKQPIGKHENAKPFTSQKLQLEKGDALYLFSDGYSDQFGGEKGKKYRSAHLKDFLLSVQNVSMNQQKDALHLEFEAWKGKNEQVDDVLIIGIRV